MAPVVVRRRTLSSVHITFHKCVPLPGSLRARPKSRAKYARFGVQVEASSSSQLATAFTSARENIHTGRRAVGEEKKK